MDFISVRIVSSRSTAEEKNASYREQIKKAQKNFKFVDFFWEMKSAVEPSNMLCTN